MRHAQSDWSAEDASDHARPLNDRGIRDTPAMARWIVESGFLPDLILCSSATRTQQTAALLNTYWQNTGHSEANLLVSPDLYLSPEQGIFAALRDQAGADPAAGSPQSVPRTVLVLAHNPGLSHAASVLAGYPIGLGTAALAVLRCALEDWSAPLRPTLTECVTEMSPKSLAWGNR